MDINSGPSAQKKFSWASIGKNAGFIGILSIFIVLFLYGNDKYIEMKTNEKCEQKLAVKLKENKEFTAYLKDKYENEIDSLYTNYKEKEINFIAHIDSMERSFMLKEDKYIRQIARIMNEKNQTLLDISKYVAEIDSLKKITTKHSVVIKQKKALEYKLKLAHQKIEQHDKIIETLTNKVVCLRNERDELNKQVTDKDEEIITLKEEMKNISDAAIVYQKGQEYEYLGDTETGWFKSKHKRLQFYLLADEYYTKSFNMGMDIAKKKVNNVRAKIDDIDRDKIRTKRI